MLDIIIPSKGRDHLIPGLIKNIEESTETDHRIVFVFELQQKPVKVPGCTVLLGEYGSPAKAVNEAFKVTDGEFFLFGNDDFNFQPDWYKKALAKMNEEISVVAINDGNPAEVQWGTITLVKRSYITDHGGTENKGEVFHEGYNHFYIDSEFWYLANQRGVADTAPDSVIIHEHPAFGFPGDKLHKKKGMEKDSQLFMARKQLDL